ncbi:hypothetical protein S2M10_06650 [Sphingomonas sp. S2M10]|uniref:hypothetical protein n=1 Tax=Sphingomonas sp. S2M10 TaxID=2705010 RepID=UPI0014577629|nr:hypothetical protein [Sphingomonas sp. S2M10]NLS25695.1 hypothetical protein [Sphingomonas sp. S2M10]
MGHASLFDVITVGLIIAFLLGMIVYNIRNIRYGECKDCGAQVGDAESECADCYAERCGYPRTGNGRFGMQSNDATSTHSVKAVEPIADN